MLEQYAVDRRKRFQYFEFLPCVVVAVYVYVGSKAVQVGTVRHTANVGIESCRAIAAGHLHGLPDGIPERLQHGSAEVDEVHHLQFRRRVLQARVAGASQLFEREVGR